MEPPGLRVPMALVAVAGMPILASRSAKRLIEGCENRALYLYTFQAWQLRVIVRKHAQCPCQLQPRAPSRRSWCANALHPRGYPLRYGGPACTTLADTGHGEQCTSSSALDLHRWRSANCKALVWLIRVGKWNGTVVQRFVRRGSRLQNCLSQTAPQGVSVIGRSPGADDEGSDAAGSQAARRERQPSRDEEW